MHNSDQKILSNTSVGHFFSLRSAAVVVLRQSEHY